MPSELLSMHKALNKALHDSMQEDENIIVYGQDVASCGGVFRITDNLKEKFGTKRIFNTPLSECLLAGMTVGMALHGIKPICEIQFMGFAYSTLDQMINHISRIYYRSKNMKNCPCVFRIPYGGQIPAPEHHADSYEQLFATIPGLQVITPSDAQMAYTLLRNCIKNNNPTVFLEPIYCYHQKDRVDCDIKIDHLNSRYIRTGKKITIIAWGGMIKTIQQALSDSPYRDDYTLIDLLCLNPIDYKNIFTSVAATKKCLIIQDAHSQVSIASELSANITEQLFSELAMPVIRLTAPNSIQPPFRYREQYYPNKDKIVKEVSNMIEYCNG